MAHNMEIPENTKMSTKEQNNVYVLQDIKKNHDVIIKYYNNKFVSIQILL
jgi:hypothetical protein